MPLLENVTQLSNKFNFWASDSQRVIETAKYFATGLYGLDWEENGMVLHVIPETNDLGGDSLTPGDTCTAYRTDTEKGHDFGYKQLWKFRNTYLPAISARFNAQNPTFNFTNEEVYSMQELCGFETLVRGSSPWCDVFTHAEWLDFEYARDVLHYYRAGPGSTFSAAMGSLWVNATAKLLQQGEAAGKAFFSFVHDGDILPVLTFLDLFPESLQPSMPVTHRPTEHRVWHTSQLVPMAGRLIVELLSCDGTHQSSSLVDDSVFSYEGVIRRRRQEGVDGQEQSGTFVRININDGIVAIPGCDSGPGGSCPLDQFLIHVRRRSKEVGDFKEVCGLGQEAAERITFLHQ